MGDCGLRVQEVLDVKSKPKHVSRMSDAKHFELKVVGGKDITGEHMRVSTAKHGFHRMLRQRSTATSSRQGLTTRIV